MAENPFEPPADDSPVRRAESWTWRGILPVVLGLIEICVGLALDYRGFRYGWLVDDSFSNVAGTMMIFAGLFCFIVPGFLLCVLRRWVPQVLPALFVTFVFAVAFASRSHSP